MELDISKPTTECVMEIEELVLESVSQIKKENAIY